MNIKKLGEKTKMLLICLAVCAAVAILCYVTPDPRESSRRGCYSSDAIDSWFRIKYGKDFLK